MSVVETIIEAGPGQVVALPVDQVHPAPDNVRTDLGDLDGLAVSIADAGLIHPIVVHPRTEGGWEIIAGHRRHAAHVQAGLDTVDAIVRDVDDPAALTATRMVENLQRQDLPVGDEARGYKALVALGWTQRKIAEAVGVNQSHVSKRIRMADLPDDLLAGVQDGTAHVEDAVDLARLYERDEALAGQVLLGWRQARKPFMLERAGRELEALKQAAARQKAIDDAVAAHEAGTGLPVLTDIGPNLSYPALRARGMIRTYEDDPDWDRMLSDGNVALAADADGKLVHVCTDAAAYEEAKPNRTSHTDEMVAARRVEQEARRRREHKIADMVTNGDPPPAHQLLIRMVTDHVLPLTGHDTLIRLCQLLDVDVPKSAPISRKVAALIGDADTDRPSNIHVDRIRTIAWAAVLLAGENHTHGLRYRPPDDRQRAHMARLVDAGHELADVEQAWLDMTDDQEDDDG